MTVDDANDSPQVPSEASIDPIEYISEVSNQNSAVARPVASELARPFLPVLLLCSSGDSPSESPSVQGLRNSENQAERNAANALNALLTSTNATEQSAGRQLSTMLNGSPEQHQFAVAILNHLQGADRDRMLQIIRDQPQAAAQLRQLLVGENETACTAARNLLEMMVRSPHTKADRQDIATLTGMLRNENQCELATRILAHGDQDQRHQLARLAGSERSTAADRLLSMLGSVNGKARAGAALLLHSLGEGQNRDGRLSESSTNRLLAMLNSNHPQEDAELASRVLRAVRPNDPSRTAEYGTSVEQLTRLMGRTNPDGTPDRRGLNSLLTMFEGNMPQRAYGSRMIALLAGRPEQAAQADSLLSMMATEAGRAQAVSILRLDENQSNTLMALPDAQRQYIINLITPHASGTELPVNDPLRTLTHAQRQRIAESLLNNLGPERAGIQTAGTDDNLTGIPRPDLPAGTAREDAQRLMAMLVSGDVHQVARAGCILTNLSDARARHSLLALIPQDDRPVAGMDHAQSIFNMLQSGNSKQRDQALSLLNGLDDPAQLRHVLSLLAGNEQQRTQGEQITTVLGRDSGHARRVINLLRSADNQDQQAGVKALHNLIPPRGQSYSNTEIQTGDILNIAQNNEQIRALMQLREGQPQAYERLMGLLAIRTDCDSNSVRIIRIQNLLDQIGAGNADALRLVRWLDIADHGSLADERLVAGMAGLFGTPEGDASARRFMDALESKDDKVRTLMRTALSRIGSSHEIAKLDDLMQDPQTRGTANHLISMLNGKPADQRGATNLLKMFNNKASEAARDLVSQLQNPQTRAEAQRLISSVSNSSQLTALNRLPQGAARTEILSMLNSPDSAQQNGARNLLELLSEEESPGSGDLLGNVPLPKVGLDIQAMLANPATRDQAVNLLTRAFESPRHLAMLANMLIPVRDAEGRTSENPKAQSARWLLEQLGNPNTSTSTSNMLFRVKEADQLDRLASLLRSDSPAQRTAGESLRSLLNSDELEDMVRAENALRLLSNASSRDSVVSLLQMLNSGDQEQRRHASEFLSLGGTLLRYGALAAILADQRYKDASDYLIDLLSDSSDRSASQTVSFLLELLANSETAAEGRRLLDMLNNPSQQESAWRQLQRCRPPVP